LVGQLLTPRLDREVLLGIGDFRLAGITVLGDQVAGEPGELKVGNFPRGIRPDSDHFAGAGKMVARLVTRLLA
jgi:hypothetical protein